MAEILTPAQLQELLATVLEGACGETRRHWIEALGPVEKLPLHSYPRCNWRLHPSGRAKDVRAIEHAAEIVRQEHPYVLG